jgi:hypothetical protein
MLLRVPKEPLSLTDSIGFENIFKSLNPKTAQRSEPMTMFMLTKEF